MLISFFEIVPISSRLQQTFLYHISFRKTKNIDLKHQHKKAPAILLTPGIGTFIYRVSRVFCVFLPHVTFFRHVTQTAHFNWMRRKRKWFLRIDFGRHFRFQASDRVTIFILQDGDRTKISICFRVKNEENMFKFKGKTLIFSSNSIIKRFYNVWGVSISKGFLFA